MKRNILLIVSFCIAFMVHAAVSKTVNVITAGTLRTLFTITEMTTVTSLTVTGSIDVRDFKFMRDGITNLAVLDISEVNIQAYNGAGGTSTATFFPANEIPAEAFYNHGLTSITGITIGNSVRSIGNNAFDNCWYLTSITIGNSVRSIGNYAFNSCGGLTSITIPNSVTSIGDYAFDNCSDLISITIGNSVTSIGYYAFEACSKLTRLTIGNSVTSIGNFAFYYCSGLASLTIPNSVTSIGAFAFAFCNGLTSVIIPNSVTSIGDYAFYGCSKLTSLYVYATTPIVLSSDVFTSVNVYACTLYVPAGTKSAYQAAPIWGDFNIVEMAPTALPTLASESVNVYPNPVTDGFNIDGLKESGTLVFMDLSGKVLLTKQVKTNEYVSVSSFQKGVYIVKISTANGTIERKVLKN